MAKRFSEEHEWVEITGDLAVIGITAHAAEQLGEVVFVELKEPGERFEKGDEMGVVESVKAASEIYAPLAGEIVEANAAFDDDPAFLNKNPEDEAWLYKMKLDDPSALDGLMDRDAYEKFIG